MPLRVLGWPFCFQTPALYQLDSVKYTALFGLSYKKNAFFHEWPFLIGEWIVLTDEEHFFLLFFLPVRVKYRAATGPGRHEKGNFLPFVALEGKNKGL